MLHIHNSLDTEIHLSLTAEPFLDKGRSETQNHVQVPNLDPSWNSSLGTAAMDMACQVPTTEQDQSDTQTLEVLDHYFITDMRWMICGYHVLTH